MSERKVTGGTWIAKSGQSQMCSSFTTIASLGLRPNQTEYWWIFSDNDEHGNQEADAHLIAAASELLEACKAFIAYEESEKESNYIQSMFLYSEAVTKARAAIAKAEGNL